MSNINWRKKTLAVAEWAVLQDHFGNLQMTTGGPQNLAMFAKSLPGNTQQDIYITGPQIELIEAFSPGGWVDSPKPTGEGVSLLVGAGDPWAFFDIDK